MDYRAMAEELLDIQPMLRMEPINRRLYLLENGTFLALHYLSLQKGAIHPKELSEKMCVSTARVAALLKHMEQENMITRCTDPEDNRQISVLITDHGRELIQSKKAEAVSLMAQSLEELGQEEAQSYLRIQKKLLDNFMRKKENGAKI